MQKDRLFKLFDIFGFNESFGQTVDDNASANNLDLDDFRKMVDVENLKSELSDALENYFTDEELDALIAFYSTPIGLSALKKAEGFMDEVAAYADNYILERLMQFDLSADNGGGNNGNFGSN